MKALVLAKTEAEGILETALSKFPTENCFERFKEELTVFLNANRWSATNTFQTPPTRKLKGKLVETNPTKPTQTGSPSDECWNSPRFVAEAIRTLDKEVEKSERMKALKRFTATGKSSKPPSFDLGISPEKESNKGHGDIQKAVETEINPQPTRAKGKVKPEKIDGVIGNDGPKINITSAATRASRRAIRLGDHLRSPFVVRPVIQHVTSEERKWHEWALSGYGDRRYTIAYK